jgi:hypothetical protein
MRSSLPFWCLALVAILLAQAGAVVAQECELKTRRGVIDKQFESIFSQNGPGSGLQSASGPAWTGADSTYSVLLPNGDSAFFFSDGYIAESPPVKGDGKVIVAPNGMRMREANCLPPLCSPATSLFRSRNSMVVLSKRLDRMKTFAGPPDKESYSTSLFTPEKAAETKRYFWMGDSVVVKTGKPRGDKLWVFLLEFDSALAYYGSSIAQLSLPDFKIESIQKLRSTQQSTVAWGSALLLERSADGPVLYIYGIQNKQTINGKVPYLARVNPEIGVNGVADAASWKVWDGSKWVVGLNNARQLLGAKDDPRNPGDQISDEISVRKIRTTNGSVYVLVGMDTTIPFGKWKDITLYSACRPQGPFSAKQVVYSTPETDSPILPGMTGEQRLAGPLVVYNPHSHPQFNNGDGLLISYDTNTTKNEDLMYADSYRPRFIRVPIEGLR